MSEKSGVTYTQEEFDASKDGRDQDGPVATTGFGRIVAARKAHVEAVSAYNARHALAQSERARGNWSIKLDAEYRTMSDAQSEFIRVAQEVADAALNTSGTYDGKDKSGTL